MSAVSRRGLGPRLFREIVAEILDGMEVVEVVDVGRCDGRKTADLDDIGHDRKPIWREPTNAREKRSRRRGAPLRASR